MKRIIPTLLFLLPLIALGQQEATSDSTATTLGEVVVQARTQQLGAEVSTFIPTSRQKAAAQTATELLSRMAIPLIRVAPGSNAVTDPSGQSVDIFIDYLPASKEDIEGMRTADVRRVEYYAFPSDPRFQGKPRVLNFVMQHYAYGGYVKGYAWENTANAGQITAYGKLQYGRMTYDFAAGAFYLNQSHTGGDTFETFRLPQPDGKELAFERSSIQDDARWRRRTYWPTFRAKYASERVTLQNTLGAKFDHDPSDLRSGNVSYNPSLLPTSSFSETATSRVNSLNYNGVWNFTLSDRDALSFTPAYAFSHTRTASLYSEAGHGEFLNNAVDDSHRLSADLTYSLSFGSWGNLNVLAQTQYNKSTTSYSGTAVADDRASTLRIGPGARYSLGIGKVYASAGAGAQWSRQTYMLRRRHSAAPWADFSAQYSPSDRHNLSTDLSFNTSVPAADLLSQAVIRTSPLMSVTGCPDLKPYHSYFANLNYTYMPTSTVAVSTFASLWTPTGRYVFDYQTSPTGILRTITQPGGAYSQWNYGAYGSVQLLGGKLHLVAQIMGNSVHNGYPYDQNKTNISYAVQANFYLGNWTLSGLYFSPHGEPGGPMVSTWTRHKAFYFVTAGWASSGWNVQLQLCNFARWNWRSDIAEMRSPAYDKIERTLSINDHALARLAVTYTIGFGKKVSRGDEAEQQSAISSGILK